METKTLDQRMPSLGKMVPYVSDWQNVIIGHMQHNVRDPNRDDKHGRIFRVSYSKNLLRNLLRLMGNLLASFWPTSNIQWMESVTVLELNSVSVTLTKS